MLLSHSVYWWKTIHLYTIHGKKFNTAEDKSTTQRNDTYFIADLKGPIKFGDRPIQIVVKIFFNCLFFLQKILIYLLEVYDRVAGHIRIYLFKYNNLLMLRKYLLPQIYSRVVYI